MSTYLDLVEHLNSVILIFQRLENEKGSSAWIGNETD